MNKINPLATVSPKAVLGDNIEVGPYAFIDENVEIGDGCKIYPHAVIFPYVKMGKNCEVYPGAVLGAVPQDLKFDGEITHVVIGDNVTIRECVTINRGTKASGKGITKAKASLREPAVITVLPTRVSVKSTKTESGFSRAVRAKICSGGNKNLRSPFRP